MASSRFRPSDKGGGEGEGGHPDPERGAPPLDSPLIPTLKTRRLNSFFSVTVIAKWMHMMRTEKVYDTAAYECTK